MTPIQVSRYFLSRGRGWLTASRTGTSVTSLLGLLVATTAEVIGTGVDDDGTLQQLVPRPD